MANNTGKGQFVKGDPRCWRKGKPKEFNALRDLAQAVLAEEAMNQGQPIIINGHKATGAEVIIRQWMQSKDFQKQKGILEIAFGKVPDKVEMTGKDGGPIEHKGEPFDYAGYIAAFAASYGSTGIRDAAPDGSGESVHPADADAEAGAIPGVAAS